MGATQGFKVRVGVILIYEEKLLMVRQNQRPFWVFPGGTLEPNEGLEECAIREIQEELNLHISIKKLLYVADFMHPERQTIDIFFLGLHQSGIPLMTENENLDEIGFFTLEEFKGLNVQPQLVASQVARDWLTEFQQACGEYIGQYGLSPTTSS